MNPSTIIALVQADLFEREQRGLNKYGTTVDRKDLSELEWLQHAYEEALDLAVYLKKTIQSKKGVEEVKPKFKTFDKVRIKSNGYETTISQVEEDGTYILMNWSIANEDELELIEE